jgi:chemotaxis signal transduction protein
MLALYCVVGSYRWVVPASAVVEVLPAIRWESAAGHGGAGNLGAVLGLIRYRGVVIPCLSVEESTLQRSPQLSQRFLVIQGSLPEFPEPVQMALAVDRVLDLRAFTPQNRGLNPSTTASSRGSWFADQDGVLKLFDVAEWLQRAYAQGEPCKA